MSFTSPWPAIGGDLDTKYAKYYLFHQAFEPDNFLKVLMPPETYKNREGDTVNITEKFFGVKSFNIFIASKPYGWVNDHGNHWTFTWNNPASDYSQEIQAWVTRWEKMYGRFSSYKTLVWIDKYTATKIKEANGESQMPEMMNTTATRMEAFCGATPGFEYKGILTTLPEANFFDSVIQDFFKNPTYHPVTV